MVPGLSRLPMLQGICLQVSEARLQVWREMLLRRLTTRDYTKFSIIIIILIGIGHSYRLFSFFVIEFVFLFSCASVPQFLFSRAFLFSSLLFSPFLLSSCTCIILFLHSFSFLFPWIGFILFGMPDRRSIIQLLLSQSLNRQWRSAKRLFDTNM